MTAWSTEMVERLVALADGTRSSTVIGETLGVSRNCVIGKLTRLRAGKAIGKKVRLLPAGFARARAIKAELAAAKPAKTPKSRKVGPTPGVAGSPAFVASTPDVVERLQPEPIQSDPISFLEAATRRACLFFAGDPYGVDGPDMPVCGAARVSLASGIPPYCPRHMKLRHQPREARAA